ncbi:aldolase [Ascodesmis nigricans]|uniref:Aldolase n=1 Tax=Ascodesmis nigricans TaxID=341454 RepID=A0A4S2MTV9_9PEZI|nr:aldolase [Ascodesmis nigricans]
MTTPQSALPPPPGIYVPIPTFFTPTSTLDLSTQLTYSLHLLSHGITGLVLLGSTGEAVHLTRTERIQLITYIRRGLDTAGYHATPLIVGTASGSVEETLQQLHDAKEAGAGWGMCLMMGYFAGSVGAEGVGGVGGWWREVAEKAEIPILLYHYPAVSNNLKLPASIFESLGTHDNIVGAKFSHADIAAHSAVTLSPHLDPSNFRVYTGLGQQLLSVLLVGGAGAIDGLAAVCPKEVVALYELGMRFLGGRGSEEERRRVLEMARRLQWCVARAEELVVTWGAVGVKEALRRRGFGTGGVRRPLVAWGEMEGRTEGWGEWEGRLRAVEGVGEEVGAFLKGLE